MCAILADRKLQMYDFISGDILFEINFPNAGTYCLKNGMGFTQKTQKLFFLENDLVLAF
jgi:hypothetical protein